MNFKLDKGQLEKGGKIALRVGKAIVVEGIKGLAMSAASAAITSALTGKGVSGINLDTVLGEETKRDSSKKWFSRDKKEDEIEEFIEEVAKKENIKDEKKDSPKVDKPV